MSQQDVAALVSEVDRARGRLRALLRSKNPGALARRPANGDWSIIENVRHLLFAEQAHLGRFLAGGFEWSPAGMRRRTSNEASVPGLSVVGTGVT
ncbi:MAG: DinB family protein [Dehalococcoidia bacterium]